MSDYEKIKTECDKRAEKVYEEIINQVKLSQNFDEFDMTVFKGLFAVALGCIIIKRDFIYGTDFFERLKLSMSERVEKEFENKTKYEV